MATSPLVHLSQENGSSVGIPLVGLATCGTVVRKSAILEAGGFEQRFGVGGEEQVLALDLLHNGWQRADVDEIVAHHYPSPVRDVDKRKRHEVRNALWSAWLRRPALSSWNATRRILRTSLGDRARLAGILDAIKGLPWAFSSRRPVSVAIGRQLQ